MDDGLFGGKGMREGTFEFIWGIEWIEFIIAGGCGGGRLLILDVPIGGGTLDEPE